MEITGARELLNNIRDNISRVIQGKNNEIMLVLLTLTAGGHVLLEDAPGTGKTNLCKALAKSLRLSFSRIQFTPDLLPSELTGINIYSPKTGEFTFREGSLYASVILADEINRATPRTQSGLLESMEERQISVDGVTRSLPNPYFVLATQNPVETQGTYPLPEAQLDRFMIKLTLGYPSNDESAGIIKRYVTSEPMEELRPVCGEDDILELIRLTRGVFIHDVICRYIADICEASRSHAEVILGASTRGAIALARICQARALSEGRDYVIPDDVKTLAPYALAHRLITRSRRDSGKELIASILNTVNAPTEDWKK